MPEWDWLDQALLVSLWVGLIYTLFGLAMGYLALTDLEWRQVIAARLRRGWRELRGSRKRG